MATTSVYGLPYLEDDDPPDIPEATQGLAEAVEVELARVDSAMTDLQVPVEITSGLVAQDGFAVAGFRALKIGALVTVYANLTAINALEPGSDEGMANVTCAVLPVGCRPRDDYLTVFGNGTNSVGSVLIWAGGELRLLSLNLPIPAGTTFQVSATYLT